MKLKNNDKKVSKSTRDRVQKIIEDNNFIKRSDYSRHTNNTIVYMCSGTDSGDMADKITYLSDSLYKSGYKTAIACCNQDETAKKNNKFAYGFIDAVGKYYGCFGAGK